MQPRIRALILAAPEVPEAERAESVFAQLQTVFASMALGIAHFATPEGFWRAFKDYDGQPIDVREHQDAYEFFTRLQVCVGCVGGWVHACALMHRVGGCARAWVAGWLGGVGGCRAACLCHWEGC